VRREVPAVRELRGAVSWSTCRPIGVVVMMAVPRRAPAGSEECIRACARKYVARIDEELRAMPGGHAHATRPNRDGSDGTRGRSGELREPGSLRGRRSRVATRRLANRLTLRRATCAVPR